jgi:O-antigen ligase
MYGLPYALHPHNIFLSFWLSTGLLGLISFLVILGQLVRSLKSKASANPLAVYSLAAALVAVLVHGLFDTTYFYLPLAGLFWILCVLILRNADGK